MSSSRIPLWSQPLFCAASLALIGMPIVATADDSSVPRLELKDSSSAIPDGQGGYKIFQGQQRPAANGSHQQFCAQMGETDITNQGTVTFSGKVDDIVVCARELPAFANGGPKAPVSQGVYQQLNNSEIMNLSMDWRRPSKNALYKTVATATFLRIRDGRISLASKVRERNGTLFCEWTWTGNVGKLSLHQVRSWGCRRNGEFSLLYELIAKNGEGNGALTERRSGTMRRTD